MRHLLIILLALIALNLCAANLSPEEVASEITAVSPRIKTLNSSNEAIAAQLLTDSNLPDPEIEGEFLAAPSGEKNRWGAGISWSLDWPGVYSAKKKLSSAAADSEKWNVEIEKRNFNIEVRRLLLDYILQSRQIKTVESLLSTTDSIANLAVKARDGGEMTLLDVNKIRLEAASLSARLISLKDTRRQTVDEISSLAAMDCSPLLEKMKIEFPRENIFSEQQIQQLIASSPSLEGANARRKVAEMEKKVADREALPSISFGYRHAFEDGNHFNGGSVGVSLPLFSSRGKSAAAKANIKAAEIAAEETKLAAESSLASALKRRNYLLKEISEISPLIEQTDNQFLLMKAYEKGVITLIDYLNERNYFLEATLQLLELRHAAAVADLNLLFVR